MVCSFYMVLILFVEGMWKLLFERAYSMNPLLLNMRRFGQHNGHSSDHQTVMLINEDLWLRIKQGSSNLYYKSKLENEDLLLKISSINAKSGFVTIPIFTPVE